jgi:putative CocE/NonD family hydrolase
VPDTECHRAPLKITVRKTTGLILACLAALPLSARALAIPQNLADDASLPGIVAGLARTILSDQNSQLTDPAALFRVQLAAGRYEEALNTLEKLRAPLQGDPSPRVRVRYVDYVLFAHAMLQSAQTKMSFDRAYADAFHALVTPLDDRTAAAVVNGLSFDNLSAASKDLDQDLGQLKGKGDLAVSEALHLVSDFSGREIYRAFGSATAQLLADDDAKRYVTQRDLLVTMPDGAKVCTLVVRPAGSPKLPALLLFTIYNDPGTLLREARRAASNQYAGVVGLTRGKGCSPDAIVPYDHDGADAAALIDWIATQPWSDARVGMYGGSYSGFTPWAATKYMPKALKAIMVGAANAPGIDAPMEGNVFWNFPYPWGFYTTDNKTLDNATYNDHARWDALNRNWYLSGRPYRDLDKIEGTPNPLWDSQIAHPSYDAYWQRLIPYKEEFARIDIPVLQTAGYYYGGPGAAVYYLSQHYQYKPKAEHYLLIGPYDHFSAQRGTATGDGDIDTLNGYKLDPAAHIDLSELRFQWFDHVFKGAVKPAILADKINYQVTGANRWKHAPSLTAMSNHEVRFYLSAQLSNGSHTLAARQPASAAAMQQTINFADRSDADLQTPGGGIQDKDLDSSNAILFISEPLEKSTELSGLFSGHLEFVTNKKDFDFQVALYEKTASGDFVQLAPYWSRASYVKSLTQRELLAPGKLQTLDFHSMRLMSRQVAAGSRLIAVLGIIKDPTRQLNYGTGGEVSREAIVDAKVPLKISWHSASYIGFPASD